MDVLAQREWVHPHEHPFHFVGQFPHHIGDQLQVAGMAGAAGPTHPRLATLALASRRQMFPPMGRQAVFGHPDIAVQPGERLGQGRGGHHETVHHAEPAPHRLQDVLGHVLAVRVLQRQIGQVVVQFVHLERARQRLHPPHGVQPRFADLALQDHHVRILARQLADLQVAVEQHPFGHSGLPQGAQWLDHPVVAAAFDIGRQRDHARQRSPRLQRPPARARVGQREAGTGVQRKSRVIGWVVGHHRQPPRVHRFLVE